VTAVSEFVVSHEFKSIVRGTRQSMAASIVVHIALFLLLLLSHRAVSESMGLTEITWVDAATLAGEPDAAPPVAREQTEKAPVEPVKTRAVSNVAPDTEHFVRPLERGEISPRPQSAIAVTDLVAQKLDAYEQDAKSNRTRIAALTPPPKIGVPTLAGVSTEQPSTGSNATSLNRDVAPSGGPPAALTRVRRGPGVPVAAVTVNTPPVGRSEPAAPANPGASRNLAGAQLAGPVADRPLVSYQVPVYPEWAKRDGVEGSVTLYFFVLPDGRVKENILVERTSGFSDFDTGAVEALRKWRFQAIPGSSEQWGRITFNYRLSDAQ